MSVFRMSQLIDHVMDFARSRLGSGMRVVLTPFEDLAPPLRPVVDELRAANQSRVVTSLFDIQAVVRCDAGRIQQLLAA